MRTVTVEDATLAGLAQNPVNVDKFPFLRVAATKGAVGSCCSSNKADLNPVKAALATLPPDKLAEFKALLRTEKLRLIYAINGQVTDVTV